MRGFLAFTAKSFVCVDRSLRAFRRSEDGSMIVLFLFFIMIMMPLVGITVVMNRVELLRVQMQNTMDRAVLAAADIDQTLIPSDVVMDYFTKAGLDQFVDAADIIVTPSDSVLAARIGRNVSVCGRGVITSNITDLKSGRRADGSVWANYAQNFHDFAFNTCSAAEEVKTDIEVILVLDVSGSMEGNSKLTNLKTAAKEFVETVITDETGEGMVSIGIVPYNGQVNAAPILPYYTVVGGSSLVNCVNFTSTQFSEAALPPATTTLTRSDYFDPWNSTKTPFPTTASRDAKMPYCPNVATREIMLPTNDVSDLQDHIDGFHAAGYTSLDIGMKWGATLMDPSFRPVMGQLATAGVVPSQFSERPFDYGVQRTAKFIVLMSDGQNTDERFLNSTYGSGMSPFYVNASNQLTVYRNRSSTTSDWCRYDGSGGNSSDCSWQTTAYSGSTQLTWKQVWERHSINWVTNNPYRAAFVATSPNVGGLSGVAGTTYPATKDTRTSSICDATKTAGVTVFTIGFEAPEAGNAALLDCATSPGHFFDVDGLEISEAFQTIARKISELRLTM